LKGVANVKKIILIAILVLLIFTMAVTKPPRLVRLEVVNRSGEPAAVQLQGLGYDFVDQEYAAFRGAFYWLDYQSPPIAPNGEYIDVDISKTYTILKDRYVIVVFYEQELKGGTVCLNNWTPEEYDGDLVFFDAIKGGSHPNKIVILPCDQIPTTIGEPEYGLVKWSKHLLVVK